MSNDSPAEGPDPLDGFEVPDDLSSLMGGGGTEVQFAALITQIAGAQPLAAACSLAQVGADVVPTQVGAIAVLADLDDGAPARSAAELSALIKGVPLILVTRGHEQLTMTRFQNGESGDQLAPGLILSGAPAELEDLLIGIRTVADLDGVVASSSISRWKAMRLLTSAARKARRQ